LILFIYSAASVVEALDELENRLSSVCNQNNTSIGINAGEIFTDDNNSTVSQPSTPFGTQNRMIEIP